MASKDYEGECHVGKVTAPENPPVRVTLTVIWPLEPCVTVSACGLTNRVKSGVLPPVVLQAVNKTTRQAVMAPSVRIHAPFR